VSLPISRWLTMDFLLLELVFDRVFDGEDVAGELVALSIMEASVVLLPEPVAPTTRIRPRFSMISSLSTGGRFSVERDLLRDEADHHRIAAALAHGADTKAPHAAAARPC
jgi:hypothetical protein